MSDTYRRYSAIKRAMMQFYRFKPGSHREGHFNTLAALICGLAGGKHAHLPAIADHAPSAGATQESLIRRFIRFLKNDRQTIDAWFCLSQSNSSRHWPPTPSTWLWMAVRLVAPVWP